MFYLSYKITNSLNGKFYYGVHKTPNRDDNYRGSGVAVCRAVKKHGWENFTKEILIEHSSEEEMYAWEKDTVTEELVNDPKCYNMTLGGEGGFSHIDSNGDNNNMRRPEVKAKLSAIMKRVALERREEWLGNQKKATAAAKVTNTGRTRPEHAKLLRDRSTNGAKKWCAVSPCGRSYIISNFKQWCVEMNFVPSSCYNAVKRGSVVMSGPAAGWFFMKLNGSN